MTDLIMKDSGSRPRVVLPVIHLPHGITGGMTAIDVALSSGADGVFLINQGMGWRTMLEDLLPLARAKWPDAWIGANVLGWTPSSVMMAYGAILNGVWSDNAGVDGLDSVIAGEAAFDMLTARAVQAKRAKDLYGPAGRRCDYFGGVAFKTQAPVPIECFPELAALTNWIDVVTTSGTATGVAASVERVRALREAIGPVRPMALASGVTPENVVDYLPYVDAFLVATGIETSFGLLDRDKVERLVRAVHGWVGG